MKVLFLSAIGGEEKYLDHYKLVYKTCQELGHKVNADHLFKKKIKEIASREKLEKEYQRLVGLIKRADVVVAEITFPSTTIGNLMGVALQSFTPVLVLHQTEYHGLIVGDPNRLMQIKTYSSKNLKKVLEGFFRFAKKKKLHIRFNLMIDQEMDSFLTRESNRLKVSKAEYLRSFLHGEMRKKRR